MVESDAHPKSVDAPSGEDATQPHDYAADIGFDQFDISPALRRAIAERGYLHPTRVQAAVFAPIREGRDLIVRSKTGTGKTAAFGIPLLEKLADGERNVRVLVLCPTRELALQVATEISDLGKYRDLEVAAIYGGASMKAQETALTEGSAIIVGTPGRIYDHIRRKNLNLETCDCVVLDEADEMLDQGFYEEVTRILDCLPAKKQVLLFSATVPPDIERLINRYSRDPEALLLSGDVLTVEHIHHVRYDLSDAFPKPRNLIYMLELEEPDSAIIFCNTKDDTALVTAFLNRNGFDAELLNGDLPQKERERVMAKVKRGEVAFMVATDIAARGIDISDLTHVINYSLPEDPAVYLHRVGRTGRIGKKGVALNLVSGRELTTLSALEKRYGIVFEKRPMPTPEEAIKLWTDRHVREIRHSSAGAIYEGLLPLASQLRQRADADDLVAFLLKYFFTHHRMEKLNAAKQESDGSAGAPVEPAPPPRRRRERRTQRTGQETGGERRRSGRTARPAPGPPASANDPRSEPMVWINLGKSDGLDAAGVIAAAEAAGAPAGKIRRASVRPTYSYLTVAEEDLASVEALTGRVHGQKALRVERAKKRR